MYVSSTRQLSLVGFRGRRKHAAIRAHTALDPSPHPDVIGVQTPLVEELLAERGLLVDHVTV
jgi:hypothetical protein